MGNYPHFYLLAFCFKNNIEYIKVVDGFTAIITSIKKEHIMRQGKVKWYNGKKCFGFITPDTPNEDGNTDDVFVHSSALKAAEIRFLNENDIVEFEEEVRNGKLSVTTLKLIQRDEESAKRFQERRAERRRAREERKGREEKKERRGFAFWKK
jgi:CspA family cold shock protein